MTSSSVTRVSKDEAERRFALIKARMEEHGLVALGWRRRLSGAKSQAGSCAYASKTIRISKRYLWSSVTTDDAFLNTVLHEIAHALAGNKAGHGPVWREVALRIGCDGKRCLEAGTDFAKPAWLVRCPCGKTSLKRHSVQAGLLKRVCSACKGALHATAAR